MARVTPATVRQTVWQLVEDVAQARVEQAEANRRYNTLKGELMNHLHARFPVGEMLETTDVRNGQ
jgi:hypothetical protein